MITKDIRYIGVYDANIDLFEGQYRVPDGITYNSYLICDEKTAVMDTADRRFVDEWLANIDKELAAIPNLHRGYDNGDPVVRLYGKNNKTEKIYYLSRAKNYISVCHRRSAEFTYFYSHNSLRLSFFQARIFL